MTRCFVVPGEPRGKGRPRVTRNGTYTDSETAAYEKKIVACFWKDLGGYKAPDTAFLRIQVIAYLGIPKSATVAQKQAMEAGCGQHLQDRPGRAQRRSIQGRCQSP